MGPGRALWGQNALHSGVVFARICIWRGVCLWSPWWGTTVRRAGLEGHSRSCCVISYTCTWIYNFFKIKGLIKRAKPVSTEAVLHKGKETLGEEKYQWWLMKDGVLLQGGIAKACLLKHIRTGTWPDLSYHVMPVTEKVGFSTGDSESNSACDQTLFI